MKRAQRSAAAAGLAALPIRVAREFRWGADQARLAGYGAQPGWGQMLDAALGTGYRSGAVLSGDGMVFRTVSLVLGLLAFVACTPSVNPKDISQNPATDAQMAKARAAVRVCGRNIAKPTENYAALKAAGFVDTDAAQFAEFARERRARFLEAPGLGVYIVLASRSQRACIVGVEGMTPQQSFALAQPWVSRFNAITNAEAGQGLSNLAVQAWRYDTSDELVFIAAYKTWRYLDGPGAAVRLLYSLK